MGKTMDNLAAAFAGESQANRKYLAFAQQADKEGYKQIARLFRAAAAAETVHALGHFKAMGGIKDTKTNLQAAVEGEGYEFKTMYPKFIAVAKEEGERSALRMFEWANEVEEVHYGLYEQAAVSLKAGGDLPEEEIYVCSVCGNTVSGSCPEKCSVCGVPGGKFDKVS